MTIGRLGFDRAALPAQGRNWVSRQASLRLREAAERFNQEQANAVAVHGTPVRYLSRLRAGHTCTCHLAAGEWQKAADAGGLGVTKVEFGGGQDPGVDLFESSTEALSEANVSSDSADGLPFGSPLIDDMFGNTTACHCCYRSGFVGGYQEVHRSRQVFDCQVAVDGFGFDLDEAQSPHRLVAACDEAHVTFEVTVPWDWTRLEYGVFDNGLLLDCGLWHEGRPLTEETLRRFSGQTIDLSVLACNPATGQEKVQQFSHLVCNFVLPSAQLVADFPQETRNLDYSRFENVQQQTAVFSHHLPASSVDDVVIKQGASTTLHACTDVAPYRLQDGTNMGHTLTLRVVQPDELLMSLNKHHTL